MPRTANHFRKKEGRGGWLTLTHTCLAFRTHGMNIQNTPLDISLQDVDSVAPSLTLGLIPNGLKFTINGMIESFVVSNRRKWVEQIEELRPNQLLLGNAVPVPELCAIFSQVEMQRSKKIELPLQFRSLTENGSAILLHES